MPTIEAKRKAVNERIGSLERAIRIAREYLESGMHAAWLGFRPLFGRGANLPPHKDWVKNVFLRRREKALGGGGETPPETRRPGTRSRAQEPCAVVFLRRVACPRCFGCHVHAARLMLDVVDVSRVGMVFGDR